MLSQYVAAFVITALTHVTLAIVVYLKGPRRLTHITYAIYAVAVAWWSAFETAAIVTADPVRALILWRCCIGAVIFIPIIFVHFIITLHEPEERATKLRLIRTTYLIGLGFLLLNFTPLFIAGAGPKLSFKSFMKPGLFYPWFLTLWIGWASYGVFVLLPRLYRRSVGLKRIQLNYLCFAWLMTYVGGVPNFLPLFNIEIPVLMPYGTFAVPLGAMVTAYAIARYRLLDIYIAVTRTTVFMTVYAVLLGVPLLGAWAVQAHLRQALGPRWWVWLWITAALMATAAHYVSFFFQRRADRRLLRAQRRYHGTLLQASQGMTDVRELKLLLNLILHVLTKTVGLSGASIFLDERPQGSFRLAAVRYQRDAASLTYLPADDPLIELLKATRQPIVCDELKLRLDTELPTGGSVTRQVKVLARLKHMDAGVIVPTLMDKRLIGFVVLGDKRNTQLFTTEDLGVFSTLASQAAISIENARFYEEERQRQASLFHAAGLASLGTMASSMGHQVNNRFNVVSVITSIQQMKLQEVLARQQDDPAALRQALAECVEQFESLQEEALRGGRVVSSIRKIARPSSEGYQTISIAAAIQAGLDVARYKGPFQAVDVRVDVPTELPKVHGDLAQLGECILNLLDNAHDAIKVKEQRIAEGLMKTDNGSAPFHGVIQVAARSIDADSGLWPWTLAQLTPLRSLRAARREAAPGGARGTKPAAPLRSGTEPVEEPDLPSQMVEVRIIDNGMGMTREDLDKLFIPFYTTKATAEKGAGLGLYVIRQIMEAHRGSIRVESTPGKGTTVILQLPVQEISQINSPKENL